MQEKPNTTDAFEGSLREFGSEIQELKRSPESATLSETDIVRRSLRSYADRSSVPEHVERSLGESAGTSVLPSYLDSDATDPKVRAEVEELVALAFAHGLLRAFSAAKRHSPFVQDALHDALVEKLLPELRKRKMIS